MKTLTPIQKLELAKREYHKQKNQERYPNGCFSLQIRTSTFLDENKNLKDNKMIGIRWGIKTTSTYYNDKGFEIRKNDGIYQKFEHINNSFGKVYNYNTLEKLLQKILKENIEEEQVALYLKTLPQYVQNK